MTDLDAIRAQDAARRQEFNRQFNASALWAGLQRSLFQLGAAEGAGILPDACRAGRALIDLFLVEVDAAMFIEMAAAEARWLQLQPSFELAIQPVNDALEVMVEGKRLLAAVTQVFSDAKLKRGFDVSAIR